MKQSPDKDGKPQSQSILRYTGLAMQWLVMLGVAVWLGMALDRWIGWKFPVFLVLLPLIALIGSLWKIIKEFSKPKK